MLRHRLFVAALAALGVAAAAALPARAQSSYAGGGALSGYTSGSQIDRRPVVPVTAYPATTLYLPGYRGTLWSPIFMTSINYPGVYGSYTLSGVANNSLYFREPMVYPRDNSSVVSPVSTTITPPAYTAPLMGAGLRTTALTTPADVATVRVRVPADARVYFEGELTTTTGPERLFESPPLERGRNYRYDIRAVWDENGREVIRSRSVMVRAGETANVDLRVPAVETPTLRTRPNTATAPPLPEATERQTTPGVPPERARDQGPPPSQQVKPPAPQAQPGAPGARPEPTRTPGLPASQSLSPANPQAAPGRPSNPTPPTPASNRREALERAPGRSPGP